VGIKVSAAEAAELADRNERVVRGWIKSGKLRAEPAGPRQPERGRAGPSRWAIDVDDLAQVPGVAIDRERLAQIEAAGASTPGGILARLETIEREVQSLRARVRDLELKQDTSQNGISG
jgi:polyhydroxyalkanoate synthesis regulator phasin